MMLEGPLFHATIGRLAEATRNLRAWGLNMQLSLLIESPVIMLLATSIALVHDRQSYVALRRFTLMLCALCTGVAAVVGFSSLFDQVAVGLLGYPQETADAARVPLRVMLFWSAAIGWRRFCQGLLIRNGGSRWVTVGTAGRLGSMALSCTLLVAFASVSGAVAAAIAMMVGVTTEALLSSRFVLPVVRYRLASDAPEATPLTTPAIWKFHLPLAATTLLGLSSGPIVAAALAHLPDHERTLAAWPVVFSLLLVLRGWGFAVQEATVSQLRTGDSGAPLLLRFALGIGAVSSAVTVLLTFGPVLGAIASALSLPADLLALVRKGVLWSAALPLLTALGSWCRGVLTAHGRTVSVYWGMTLALAVQCGALWVAHRIGADPIASAATALVGAELAACAYAGAALRRARSETG